MAYCTEAQATAAGATGTSQEILDAITAARVTIDRFTRAWWEPTAVTWSAVVDARGWAPVPRPVQTVTSVTLEGAEAALDASVYVVRSSTVPGEVDGVELRSWGSNVLIGGAEPWVGGFANLARKYAGSRLLVVGEFGEAVVPDGIRRAAALLAASITTEPAGDTGISTDSEGNSTTITVDLGTAPMLRSTGVPAADALLVPYLSQRVMIG